MKYTLLIADESPNVNSMIAHSLDDNKFQTISAQDLLLVHEAVTKHHTSLIITGGYWVQDDNNELVESLREAHLHKNIPIIMLCSTSSQAHRQRAFDIGCAGVLLKPFTRTTLIELVSQLLPQNLTKRNS